MEERKIIDLTGNREEKIAPKTPGGNPEAEKPHGPGGKNSRPRDDRRQMQKQKKNKNKNLNHKKRRDQERKNRQDNPAEEPKPEYVEEQADGRNEPEESAYGPGENVSPADTEPHEDGEPAPEAPSETPEEPAAEPVEIIGIRFRGSGKVYFFSPNGISFSAGDHAIVETVRGMEFGDVVDGNRLVPASDIVQPLKPVLRKADEKDLAHFQSNCRQEEEAKPVFVEKVQKNKLEMQLVDVEYTFDNTKLCFYFTADGRVDFRELVKDLAAVFHTRIELRQIGPRDEARLCGGIGMCGRPVCCKLFLSDFAQVTIKMAKDQGLALASAKINGICGKLMCCVKYEQPVYEMESKRMPQPESEIDTPKGKAVVLESNFLSDQVKVKMKQDDSIRTFSMAELTGEEKLLKAERRPKLTAGEFALRDVHDTEPAEDDGSDRTDEGGNRPGDGERQSRKDKQGQKPKQKQNGEQSKGGGRDGSEERKVGKEAGKADGKQESGRDRKGNEPASGKNASSGKPQSSHPHDRNAQKNKHRFRRPNNVQSKDGSKKQNS